jgi:hypothetical protein
VSDAATVVRHNVLLAGALSRAREALLDAIAVVNPRTPHQVQRDAAERDGRALAVTAPLRPYARLVAERCRDTLERLAPFIALGVDGPETKRRRDLALRELADVAPLLSQAGHDGAAVEADRQTKLLPTVPLGEVGADEVMRRARFWQALLVADARRAEVLGRTLGP